MQFCQFSESCMDEFPSLFSSAQLLSCWQRCVTLFQLLENSVFQAILFTTMHKKRTTINANTDHIEILDVSGGGSGWAWWSSVMENIVKLSERLAGLSKNACVCDDGENNAYPGWDSACSGDASDSSTVVAQLLSNLSFLNLLFIWPRNAPKKPDHDWHFPHSLTRQCWIQKKA